MSQNFQAGDFLVFQLESGFALLRLLGFEGEGTARVWHLAAYSDFYPDVESAESASANPAALAKSSDHIALSTRAFESTQVARISNMPLTHEEIEPLNNWRNNDSRGVSDRSVRLMLGFR